MPVDGRLRWMDCVCDLDRLDSQSPRPALSQTKPRFDPAMNLTVCLRLGLMLAMLSPGLPASAAEAATNSTVATTNTAKGCTDFLLVRDQASCCFGAAPKMNHWIHVTAPEPGLRVMTGRPITVLGTLRIGPFIEDGSVTSIYEMAGDKLELPDLR